MLISSHVVGFRLEELGLGLGWISFFGGLFVRIGLIYLWLVPLVEINTLYQEDHRKPPDPQKALPLRSTLNPNNICQLLLHRNMPLANPLTFWCILPLRLVEERGTFVYLGTPHQFPTNLHLPLQTRRIEKFK